MIDFHYHKHKNLEYFVHQHHQKIIVVMPVVPDPDTDATFKTLSAVTFPVR